MVTGPTTHRASVTVGELRAFFADDHVHMALLVDEGVIVGAVERADLDDEVDDRASALALARLEGRAISPDVPADLALRVMRRGSRRCLAVTTGDASLLGLLCLKKDASGFCSDADVSARRLDALRS